MSRALAPSTTTAHAAFNDSPIDCNGMDLDLCSPIPFTPGIVPRWVQMIPGGEPMINGFDGRFLVNSDPQGTVDHFKAQSQAGRAVYGDYDHAFSVMGPKGGEAISCAKVDDMEVREGGAVWAKVTWTPKARAHIENLEYRHLSPEVYIDANKHIKGIKSFALTNSPNLLMTALNSRIIPQATTTAMNSVDRQIADQFGISHEDFANAGEPSPGNYQTATNQAGTFSALSEVDKQIADQFGISHDDFANAG